MILQRIAEQLRKQNWVAVGIEFLIVLLGVWLGLQAQEWSNARADRQRELQLVNDMLGDIEIDRAVYATAMRQDRIRIGTADSALRAAGSAPLAFHWEAAQGDLDSYSNELLDYSQVNLGEPEALWTNIIMGYFPTVSTTTYDSMTGAGDMKLVRDRSVLRAIQAYHNRSQSVVIQNQKLLEVRQDGLRVGAKFGLAPYADMPAIRFLQLVATNPELEATIRNQATFTVFHFGDIKSADREAAALEKRLKAYRDRLQ